MPAETILVIAAICAAFGGFAAAIAYVDVSTRDARRRNHPLPGE